MVVCLMVIFHDRIRKKSPKKQTNLRNKIYEQLWFTMIYQIVTKIILN